MQVQSCQSSGMEVSPETYNACTFEIIDKWDPTQHAKTCDTMFYLRDGTGAYVWDCDKWIFLDFTGYTAPDWKAKEGEAGFIKNKPFETLGNGLTVDENGVLNITSLETENSEVISDASLTSKQNGLTVAYDSMKVISIVKGTRVTSVEAYIHNLSLTGTNVSIGNKAKIFLSVTLPEGYSVLDDRLPLQANCDSGGVVYSGSKFLNYKCQTGDVSVTALEKIPTLGVQIGFYLSENFPDNFTSTNFRDVRIKLI